MDYYRHKLIILKAAFCINLSQNDLLLLFLTFSADQRIVGNNLLHNHKCASKILISFPLYQSLTGTSNLFINVVKY